MNVLDLFSGIGGFSLGLERAGMQTVAFCEIEPFPRSVLAERWPDVPCFDDVRTLDSARLAADGISVDVICGGFPCQDISSAGFRLGMDGERTILWQEIVRLARDIRPKYIIMENVSGLLALGMGDVLGGLAEIGYDAFWHCLPASFLGASHQRDRIWIIAYPAQGYANAPMPERVLEISQQIARLVREAGSTAFCEHEGITTIGLDGQSALCRKDDGISYSLGQSILEGCGNAVVPAIPEIIGRAIMRVHEAA